MNVRSHLLRSIETSLDGIPYGREAVAVSRPNDALGLSRTVEWASQSAQLSLVMDLQLPTLHSLTEIDIMTEDPDQGLYSLKFHQERQGYPTADPRIARPKRTRHYEGHSDELKLLALGHIAFGLGRAVGLINDSGKERLATLTVKQGY